MPYYKKIQNVRGVSGIRLLIQAGQGWTSFGLILGPYYIIIQMDFGLAFTTAKFHYPGTLYTLTAWK